MCLDQSKLREQILDRILTTSLIHSFPVQCLRELFLISRLDMMLSKGSWSGFQDFSTPLICQYSINELIIFELMLTLARRNFSIRKALYAGSFDPPSSGHLDIIERGLTLCDRLYVGIGVNINKKPVFPVDKKVHLLEKITEPYKGKVEIVTIEGLLADFVKENNVDFFIRGIRSYADLDSEITMGVVNRKLSGRETVLLHASTNRVHISSSYIRELASYQKKLENFVPNAIEEEVYEHLFNYYRDLRQAK